MITASRFTDGVLDAHFLAVSHRRLTAQSLGQCDRRRERQVDRRCAMSFSTTDRPTDRECPRRARGLQQEDHAMNSIARRMFELVEPIGVIPYSANEPNEAMSALGFTNYWDTYFAGRAAPLGLVPAEVVDALFYNFAPGEVARHIPKVWRTTARGGDRRSPGRLREGAAADPRRSR